MSRNTITILGALALVFVAAAVFAVRSQPRIEETSQAGQLLFPTLVKDLERLKTVAIQQGGQTMTFDHDAAGWHFRERNGYAVDGEKVTAMAVRMARMTKLESKTKLADRYDRLELGDPAAKGGQARLVTLTDAAGKDIAKVIVGKRKYTLGGKEGGTYVRFPGDPQTWLALGDLMVGDQPHDWLKRDIADIKETTIKRVSVTRPGGEKIIASKASPTAKAFTLENMPKGMELVSDFAADDFSKLLANFQLDDVAKADAVTFPKDKTVSAVIEGTPGFQVNLDMYENDGKYWVKLKGTPPTGASAGDDKTDWAKVIADLNTTADGWVFQVPQYEIVVLTKSMGDLTKKPEPKTAAPPPSALPPGLMQSLHP